MTRLAGRPIASATRCFATIGLFDACQSSARSPRTSATHVCTSSGAWGAKGKSNVRSIVNAPSGGAANGNTAACNRDRICGSDNAAFGPGSHVMRSASRAACAWPNVVAATAIPVGIGAMPTTPGIERATVAS